MHTRFKEEFNVIKKPMQKPDDPEEIAVQVSRKYNQKGYTLDFTGKSLETEIDKILEKELPKNATEISKLESELTAYIGETLCQNFKAEWKGDYYLENSELNFYSCKIHKNGFEFGPSHFVSYYLSNGKESEGSFKNYLYANEDTKGIDQGMMNSGLIDKLKAIG